MRIRNEAWERRRCSAGSTGFRVLEKGGGGAKEGTGCEFQFPGF